MRALGGRMRYEMSDVDGRTDPGPRSRREGGYVLIWALFGFVILGGLATASLRTSGAERRYAKATAEWNESFYAAEVGLQQALGLATDSALGGLAPGDSVDFGWRAIDGTHEFRAVVYRIDNGPHLLYKVNSTGRQTGLFGGWTSVSQVVTTASDVADGLVFDRGLTVSGNVNVSGGCRIHANDWIYVSGSLTTDGPVSSGGSIEGNIQTTSRATDAQLSPTFGTGGTNYITADGSTGSVDAYSQTEATSDPESSYQSFCQTADYIVQNGQIGPPGGNMVDIGREEGLGSNWSLSNGNDYRLNTSHELEDGASTKGSFCVDGNFRLDGSPGSPSSPRGLSVAATGAIEIPGSPFIQPAPGAEILILALGDLRAEGTGDPSTPNYRGEILVGSQCEVRGSARLDGSFECLDRLDPAGMKDLVHTTDIVGDLELVAACNASSMLDARPLATRAWRHDNLLGH